MTLTVLEILQGGRDHLADPARWHKGSYFDRTYAANVLKLDGEDLDASTAVPMGCPACAMGALAAKTGVLCWSFHFPNKTETTANQTLALLALRAALPPSIAWIPDYNDDPKTTHADILALFDRAIAAVQAEGTPACPA